MLEASFTLRPGYFSYKFNSMGEGTYHYRAVGYNMKSNEWLCGNDTQFILSL